MKGKIIAYCGIACTDCDARKATVAEDKEAIRKIAEMWSKQYGMDIKPEYVWCLGCFSEEVKCGYCAECKIRACASSKGIESCAHCDDYACDILEKWFSLVPGTKETLDGIRKEL